MITALEQFYSIKIVGAGKAGIETYEALVKRAAGHSGFIDVEVSALIGMVFPYHGSVLHVAYKLRSGRSSLTRLQKTRL